MRSRTTAAAVTLFLVLPVCSGCSRVAANYPAAAPRARQQTIDPLTSASATFDGVTIRVGEVWDRSRLLAARDEIDEQMRAAMGDAAFAAMVAEIRGRNPCLKRLDDLSDRTVFRGAIELHTDRTVVVERGAVILTLAVASDTFRVRDEGIMFIRHESRPLECLFTRDGPVRYDRSWNDLPLDAENRCNILARRGGKVIAVALDSTRMRVSTR